MDLKEKLIITDKREESGARSSNRFGYQHHWALAKILDIFEKVDDFVLVMELFDDVIIIDSSQEPKFIDFYQIKTNTKKNIAHISTSVLTHREKKDGIEKDSYMEKLIDNYVRFRAETKSLHFVSDKSFKLDLNSGEDSRDKDSILLKDVTDKEFNSVKNNICNKCGLQNCSTLCKKLIYFDLSDLDVNNYRETVLGKLVFFLDKYDGGTNLSSISVYNTLINEITRINNVEKKCKNFNELLSYKSITKERFKSYIKQFVESSKLHREWPEIANDLRSENFSTMEIKRIKKQWDIHCIDILNDVSTTLETIREDVSKILSDDLSFNTYREYINLVIDSIEHKNYYKSNVFQKDYYIAIVLMELNYE